mmetsp:Transcript_104604/g.176782  ORF Transcript_104604/g.176782 Transcript_104604/m.176782 type:complete len:138 (-) Transcript_104604:494-907(-)
MAQGLLSIFGCPEAFTGSKVVPRASMRKRRDSTNGQVCETHCHHCVDQDWKGKCCQKTSHNPAAASCPLLIAMYKRPIAVEGDEMFGSREEKLDKQWEGVIVWLSGDGTWEEWKAVSGGSLIASCSVPRVALIRGGG